MIHLDTDTAIAHLRGDKRVEGKLYGALPKAAISAIALSELLYGAALSARPAAQRAKIEALLLIVDLVPFDQKAAECLGAIKADLRRRGLPTGESDALIAATALANDADLVTQNTSLPAHPRPSSSGLAGLNRALEICR